MGSQKNCDHCNEKIIFSEELLLKEKKYNFCCNGCKTVFEILHTKNLSNYYDLRKQSNQNHFQSVNLSKQNFLYLDEEKFLENFAIKKNDSLSLTFYLEGIHCIACLWLIEKLPEIEPGVLSANLNMAKSTVEIIISSDAKFSNVAKRLETLGYPPHPLLEETSLADFQRKEDQKDLIRIATAFFCAGNIMLISIPNYAGAEGGITKYFDGLGLLLFIPILFYASIPFYKSALSSLKNRSASIDLPIVMAIVLGGIFSAHNVFTESPHIYFDTLAILVFLLLLSRYLLKKSQQKGLAASEVSSFFTNVIAKKIENDGSKKELFANFLNIGDLIEISPGETVPVDSVVEQGNSSIDNSLITGEVIPLKIAPEAKIYSGTINISSTIIARVSADTKNSKLGMILKDVEKGWNKKTKIISFTDNLSKYFISFVFLISFTVFVYFVSQGMYEEAFIRALTLIIITCPCALGLTTPLSLTLTLSKLAKKGVLVKDETVIEKVNHIDNIFFDKTGTLTNGNFKVTQWNSFVENRNDFFSIMYNLERQSEHPIAVSIRRFIKENSNKEIEHLNLQKFENIIGVGPKAIFSDHQYAVRPINDQDINSTTTGLYKDEKLVLKITLEDSVKPDALPTLSKIRDLDLKTFLISGDNKNIVHKIGKELSFSENQIFGEVKPKNKSTIVSEYSNTMMLGDGANDAIALSNSTVGVAVHGSVDISLRACSVFLTNNSLDNITRLIICSKETIRLIKRNLAFSLLYNILGCILAISGNITPLLAAILMPISSFTVLISTLWGTKQLRAQTKEL